MFTRVRAALSAAWPTRRRVQEDTDPLHPLHPPQLPQLPQLDQNQLPGYSPPEENISEVVVDDTAPSDHHLPSVDEPTSPSSDSHLHPSVSEEDPSHQLLSELSLAVPPSIPENVPQPSKELSQRFLRDVRRPTQFRRRLSFAQATRDTKERAAQRFAAENTTSAPAAAAAEGSEFSPSRHSLVKLFQPRPRLSGTRNKLRRRPLAGAHLPGGRIDPASAEILAAEQASILSDEDLDSSSEAAPAVHSTSPDTSVALDTDIPTVTSPTPNPAAPTVDTAVVGSVSVVGPEVSTSAIASTVSASVVESSTSVESSSLQPSFSGPSASGPSSAPTVTPAARPKSKWPKRKRSFLSNPDEATSGPSAPPVTPAARPKPERSTRKRSFDSTTDGFIPSRPSKKKRKVLPQPYLGLQPLSPITEEAASAIKRQSDAHPAAQTALDIESDPEDFSPFKNRVHGSSQEYFCRERQSYSEPPEEGADLSDPMDIDDETYTNNPNDAHLIYSPPGRACESAHHDNPLTGDASHPLASSKPKRKSKGQDDDAAYTPAREEVLSAMLSEDESGFDILNIPKNERKGIAFDFAQEKARRLAKAINLPDGSWSREERELYLRLSMRGFEALLPEHWQFDFRTLPESLFVGVSGHGGEPLIRAAGSSELHAVKSLASLFSLGGRVRDCGVLKTRPETVIRREVRNYLRWATKDGRVRATPDATPVHAVYCQRKGESTLSAVRKLDRRLQGLARRYVSGQSHPLLTGFAICGPICAVLTYDTNPASGSMGSQDTASKFLCQLDLSDRGQDVWNALALAIAAVHVRETMAGLASQGVGGFCVVNEGGDAEDEDL